MITNVKFVLLIDDDKATNFFNTIMIDRHENFAEVRALQSGKIALEYLKEAEQGKEQVPDLIFLDINMPGMNGWEFLTEFQKIDPQFTAQIKIIILSTTSDPDEVKKSFKNYNAKDFISKPLSMPVLTEVYQNHFHMSNEKVID